MINNKNYYEDNFINRSLNEQYNISYQLLYKEILNQND